jgi:hypothetical protein
VLNHNYKIVWDACGRVEDMKIETPWSSSSCKVGFTGKKQVVSFVERVCVWCVLGGRKEQNNAVSRSKQKRKIILFERLTAHIFASRTLSKSTAHHTSTKNHQPREKKEENAQASGRFWGSSPVAAAAFDSVTADWLLPRHQPFSTIDIHNLKTTTTTQNAVACSAPVRYRNAAAASLLRVPAVLDAVDFWAMLATFLCFLPLFADPLASWPSNQRDHRKSLASERWQASSPDGDCFHHGFGASSSEAPVAAASSVTTSMTPSTAWTTTTTTTTTAAAAAALLEPAKASTRTCLRVRC